MKKTGSLLDSGDYLDYLSGVGASGATDGSLNKNPGGVIVSSPGCQGWTRTFGRHKSSIDVSPFPFNSSLRLFKNYRRLRNISAYVGPLRLPGALGIDVTQGQRAHTKPPYRVLGTWGTMMANGKKLAGASSQAVTISHINASSPKPGVGVGAVGGLNSEM